MRDYSEKYYLSNGNTNKVFVWSIPCDARGNYFSCQKDYLPLNKDDHLKTLFMEDGVEQIFPGQDNLVAQFPLYSSHEGTGNYNCLNQAQLDTIFSYNVTNMILFISNVPESDTISVKQSENGGVVLFKRLSKLDDHSLVEKLGAYSSFISNVVFIQVNDMVEAKRVYQPISINPNSNDYAAVSAWVNPLIISIDTTNDRWKIKEDLFSDIVGVNETLSHLLSDETVLTTFPFYGKERQEELNLFDKISQDMNDNKNLIQRILFSDSTNNNLIKPWLAFKCLDSINGEFIISDYGSINETQLTWQCNQELTDLGEWYCRYWYSKWTTNNFTYFNDYDTSQERFVVSKLSPFSPCLMEYEKFITEHSLKDALSPMQFEVLEMLHHLEEEFSSDQILSQKTKINGVDYLDVSNLIENYLKQRMNIKSNLLIDIFDENRKMMSGDEHGNYTNTPYYDLISSANFPITNIAYALFNGPHSQSVKLKLDNRWTYLWRKTFSEMEYNGSIEIEELQTDNLLSNFILGKNYLGDFSRLESSNNNWNLAYQPNPY